MAPQCSDPVLDTVVVPLEPEEEKQEGPEKEEDVGITFVARKAETPKQRPKSGKRTESEPGLSLQRPGSSCVCLLHQSQQFWMRL